MNTEAADEERQFLVTCNGCSFERTADGRDEATRIADEHRREREHELVALEMPRTSAASER